MAGLKDYVDKYYDHPKLGMVKVLKVVPKSRTRLEVECRDRGVGYDHDRKRYTGKRVAGGWFRGENRDFGKTFEVHKKDLKETEYE